MTIIICAIIILWLTVVAIIHQIYQLNKTIQMIDTRSQSNFSLLYRHDSLITSVNKYIDSKAMEAAIIDNMSKEKYVDDNGDIIGKDGCPVEASFIKDITEEYNMMFNQLAGRCKALEDNSLDITPGYFRAFEKDVSAGHLSNKKAIRAIAEQLKIDTSNAYELGLKENK